MFSPPLNGSYPYPKPKLNKRQNQSAQFLICARASADIPYSVYPIAVFDMKMLFCFFFILFCSTNSLFCQTIPDLQGLNWQHEAERQAFLKQRETSVNVEQVCALLLAAQANADPSQQENILARIRETADDLKARGVTEKNYAKAAKIIFRTVNERFLKQYHLEGQFADIFKDGTYNCASASALYALILETLGIPYAVVEMPQHINLMIDPGGENIAIETTDPVNGLYAVNKKQIVQSLLNLKLIPEEVAYGKQAEQLYDEYFKEKERKIDLYQLAGDLYFNTALHFFENRRYQEACNAVDKALFLNPSKLREHTRMIMLVNAAGVATDEYPENFRPHFALLAYAPFHETFKADLKRHFYLAANKYLIEAPDQAAYMAFYRYFLQQSADVPELAAELRYLHHYLQARSLSLRFDTPASLLQLDSAYQLKPTNLELQSFIVQVTEASLIDLLFATEAMKAAIATYRQRFPFLAQHPKVARLHCTQISLEVARLFESGAFQEGLLAMPALEQAATDLVERDLAVEEIIGSAFSAASAWFIRQEDYLQAESWVTRGLRYAPGSTELARKQRALAQYKSTNGSE